MKVDRIDLSFDQQTQEFIGPREDSLLKSIYLVIQQV